MRWWPNSWASVNRWRTSASVPLTNSSGQSGRGEVGAGDAVSEVQHDDVDARAVLDDAEQVGQRPVERDAERLARASAPAWPPGWSACSPRRRVSAARRGTVNRLSDRARTPRLLGRRKEPPMTTASAVPPTLADHLSAPLRVGAPDVAGALAVFPVFGPAPRLEYVSFAQGSRRGVTIKELDGGASVNDLLVVNPTDTPVLLYEGEEVLGAQQNRTFDVSVLVGAGRKLRGAGELRRARPLGRRAPRRGVRARRRRPPTRRCGA